MSTHTPAAEPPISRFPVPPLAALPDDIRAAADQVAQKTGFLPNVFLAYAHRPDHFRAFFRYYDVLMRGESGLSRAERELIAVAVSAANDCTY
jgi:uncharacterized peroxidase-related enzyme